jgi:hypothetical protein
MAQRTVESNSKPTKFKQSSLFNYGYTRGIDDADVIDAADYKPRLLPELRAGQAVREDLERACAASLAEKAAQPKRGVGRPRSVAFPDDEGTRAPKRAPGRPKNVVSEFAEIPKVQPPPSPGPLIWCSLTITGRSEREKGNLVSFTIHTTRARGIYQKWSPLIKELALGLSMRFQSRREAVRWLKENFHDQMGGLDESYLRRWERRAAKMAVPQVCVCVCVYQLPLMHTLAQSSGGAVTWVR